MRSYRVEVKGNGANAGTVTAVVEGLEAVRVFANARIKSLKEMGTYETATIKIMKSTGKHCFCFSSDDMSNPNLYKEIVTEL